MRKTVQEIVDTIKYLKGYKRDYEVAQALGIPKGKLSTAKQRDSMSFLDELVVFCDNENISLDLMRQGGSGLPRIESVQTPEGTDWSDSGSYVHAEVYPANAVVESGKCPETQPIDKLAVPESICPDGSVLVRLTGDSMEKLLSAGSVIVIDTTDREIVSGSIYMLRVPGEVNIVRECHTNPNGLILRPYNKNYPEAHVSWERFSPDMVIGRVTHSMINPL